MTKSLQVMSSRLKDNPIIPEGIDFYKAEYLKAKKKHESNSCVFSFGTMIDKAIVDHEERSKDMIKKEGGIACGKGCYFCCEQHVGVSLDEAKLLYDFILEDNVAVDWDLIKRQSSFNGETWQDQPRSDWRCPLLTTKGNCILYKHRPYVCRVHKVLGESTECNVDIKREEPSVKMSVCLDAEIALAGVWNAVDDVASLSLQLLKVKELKNED